MSVEPVTLIPNCAECQEAWLAEDGDRWRAYWIDDGPEEKLIFYCRLAPSASSAPLLLGEALNLERRLDGRWLDRAPRGLTVQVELPPRRRH